MAIQGRHTGTQNQTRPPSPNGDNGNGRDSRGRFANGSLRVKVSGDPESNPAAARQVHTSALSGAVYAEAIGPRFAALFHGLNLGQSAMTFVEDMLRRMAPRDPLEEMLAVQALLAHARVLHLSTLANQQQTPDGIRVIHEYADRASNTYRRLMLALAEYRKPPRGGNSFTAVKQANIAQQQLVMNEKKALPENATNELGFEHDGITDHERTGIQQTLPAES
ncbi:MAG: hypothetical protein HND57_10480 [Planctomycetes bacterium]|nr:hypothetical protein [Planctomycetota bacterium]